jgi:hypothetical protein
MAAQDTEKMLEDYKKDIADNEKDDYEKRTPEEKTEWLRSATLCFPAPPSPKCLRAAPSAPRERKCCAWMCRGGRAAGAGQCLQYVLHSVSTPCSRPSPRRFLGGACTGDRL